MEICCFPCFNILDQDSHLFREANWQLDLEPVGCLRVPSAGP